MNRTPFTSPAIIGPNRILRRSPMYPGGSQSNYTRGRSNHGVMRLFRAFPTILAYHKSVSILVYMKCIALMMQAVFRRTVQCKAHFGNLGIVQRFLNRPVQLLHGFALLRALIRLLLSLSRAQTREKVMFDFDDPRGDNRPLDLRNHYSSTNTSLFNFYRAFTTFWVETRLILLGPAGCNLRARAITIGDWLSREKPVDPT